MNSNKTIIWFWTCFAILTIFFNENGYNQSCRKYHENLLCKYDRKYGFQLSGQTRSAKLIIGKPATLRVMFYGGYDYVVTYCTESGFKPVHMRLLDTGTSEVLYDNMDNDYIESIGFTVDETQIINVEVNLLAEKVKPGDFDEGAACVGIIILWRKTPKVGF